MWLDLHLVTIGAEFRGGRADSAPTLDEIHTYDDRSAASKEVRFDPVVTMMKIPAVGKGRPTGSWRTKLKWPKCMGEKGDA